MPIEPRELSAEEIAEIETRANWPHRSYGYEYQRTAEADCRRLLSHVRSLESKLTEAEKASFTDRHDVTVTLHPMVGLIQLSQGNTLSLSTSPLNLLRHLARLCEVEEPVMNDSAMSQGQKP